jgi:hypothetical protein
MLACRFCWARKELLQFDGYIWREARTRPLFMYSWSSWPCWMTGRSTRFNWKDAYSSQLCYIRGSVWINMQAAENRLLLEPGCAVLPKCSWRTCMLLWGSGIRRLEWANWWRIELKRILAAAGLRTRMRFIDLEQ